MKCCDCDREAEYAHVTKHEWHKLDSHPVTMFPYCNMCVAKRGIIMDRTDESYVTIRVNDALTGSKYWDHATHEWVTWKK